MQSFLEIVIVFFLICLNGFFVASEFALVSLRKTRVDELVKKGSKPAQLIQEVLQDLDGYISATQLGITLSSLGLGYIGAPAFSHVLHPVFALFPKQISLPIETSLSFIISFLIITFLEIVLGELVPKSIALQKSEATSLFIIFPLTLFTRIFQPFISLLHSSGSLVLKLLRFNTSSYHETIYSEEEIKMILAQSGRGGIIAKDEIQMVYNVFKLGDLPIKALMLPRTDIIAFNKDRYLKDCIKEVEKYSHSRYPVYEKSIDTIIGFVHVKDIYRILLEGKEDKKLYETTILRKPIVVPETKKAAEVMVDMRKKRVHLAVVEDEYGGTSGIVSLEDIIERVVGKIEDEFDNPVEEIIKQKDGTYIVDGYTSIEKIQKQFNLPIKGYGYTTISGLVFSLLGREPKIGDKVEIGLITFQILKLKKNRIKTLKLKVHG